MMGSDNEIVSEWEIPCDPLREKTIVIIETAAGNRYVKQAWLEGFRVRAKVQPSGRKLAGERS